MSSVLSYPFFSMYYCILSEAKASFPVLSLSGYVISVPWMLTINQSKQE
jgi:hypothetical protein